MDVFSQAAEGLNPYDDDVMYGSAGNAAVSVAVMIATAAVILAVMKKSGFRAMVAVGS
jgi:hypothetical protein